MKHTTTARIGFALLLGVSLPLLADDNSDLSKTVAAMDAADKSPAARSEAVDCVAKQMKVPREKLERQRAETGLGTGGLFIANTLATETGKPFEEIVAAHQSGKGWGLIAKENGVKLGPLVSQARHVQNETRKAAKAAHGHESRDVGPDRSGPRGHHKLNPPKPRGGRPGGPRSHGGPK